ncbi:MutS protein msh4 [Sporothrix epigloea]|uniref:MutS protein msh4 n=1 Tax=Sporothrix epigloea TaxID=1892477 RepID=A0ABP0E171_9PEZI
MHSNKRLKTASASDTKARAPMIVTPSSSRWNAINLTQSRDAVGLLTARQHRTRGARTDTDSEIGPSGFNSRPSGIEQRPPFSIGRGENRGVVCAVYASKSVDRSIGLTFINVPIAEAVLTTITDTQFYPQTIHKIQMMEASRILLQSTSESAAHSGLAIRPHIEEELPGVPVLETAKANWSAEQGMQDLQRVAFKEDLPCLEFAATDNEHILCAFSAVRPARGTFQSKIFANNYVRVMTFLKTELSFDFDHHSVRIKYQPPADVMMISLPTIRSLELIQNAGSVDSRDCLYGLLKRTTTPMGSRILRSNILQPSTQTTILNPRYAAVGELARSDSLMLKVQAALQKLKPLGDIEQLLTKLVILPKDGSVYESEQSINHILKLKAFLAAIPDVYESLSDARCYLLKEVCHSCRPERADAIVEMISETIDENAAYATKPLELRNQRVHTVKHEVSASLDIQRKLYEDFSSKIHDYVNELEDEIHAKIKLKYTAARRFYLQVQANDFGPGGPPLVLVNKTKVKSAIECQTLKLMGYNERINQAVNGAMIESDERGLNKCIPNDYFATEESRFQIITGQNMSGKSTYIRAIVMLQIMAQIGCYIPADSARLPVLHSLFARVSTDDSLELNLSTFSVEMREMAFILRNVNNKSLVIVDELGRATSTRDGLAIAAAVSEALLQSKATVFFVTHFADLAKGFANSIGVVNRHLQTITEYADGQLEMPLMKMMYRVTEGAETEVSYGITLARAIGFPASFIAHAEEVAAELRAQAQETKREKRDIEEARRRKLVTNLIRQLQLAHESSAGDAELWQYLKQIHDDFWAQMLNSSDAGGGKENVDDAESGDEEAEGIETEERMTVSSREMSAVSEERYAVKKLDDADFFDEFLDQEDADSYDSEMASDIIDENFYL